MKDFRKLKVWWKAHELTLEIYKVTEKFPKEEIYGLVNQMRRSSSSIPMNIAEGCGRGGDKEFSRFLRIAVGSASELEYQLLLSYDLKFFSSEVYHRLNDDTIEIKKMLTPLIKKTGTDRC